MNIADLQAQGARLQAEGRLKEAEGVLRLALKAAPGSAQAQLLLGLTLLAQGRYREGWPLWEARHAAAGRPKPAVPFPEWRGEELAGKRLAIWPEQGLGDQIQFARFAPALAERAGEVVLLCRPELFRLFRQSLPVTVMAADGQVEFPDPDAFTFIGSTAGRLGVTPQTLPASPYLTAEARSTGARIGIAWRGNPHHRNDVHRSLPEAVARELLSLPGVISLHPEDTGARDMLETAEIIQGLERVVSVDTSTAHLAGALGKPCSVLLPARDTDWRWMRDRTDSPWYPSIRLYRQARPGDWAPVIAQLRRDLAS